MIFLLKIGIEKNPPETDSFSNIKNQTEKIRAQLFKKKSTYPQYCYNHGKFHYYIFLI